MDWALLSTVDPSSTQPSYAELAMLDALDSDLYRSLVHILISSRIDERIASIVYIIIQMFTLERNASVIEYLCGYERASTVANDEESMSIDQRRISMLTTVSTVPYTSTI
jgi:hypothetical protein